MSETPRFSSEMESHLRERAAARKRRAPLRALGAAVPVVALVALALAFVVVGGGSGDEPQPGAAPADRSVEVRSEKGLPMEIFLYDDERVPRGAASFSLAEGKRILQLKAQRLPPGERYAVWFDGAKPSFLGFAPPVREEGTLVATTAVPKDLPGYDTLLITRETEDRPERPGEVVLRGKIPKDLDLVTTDVNRALDKAKPPAPAGPWTVEPKILTLEAELAGQKALFETFGKELRIERVPVKPQAVGRVFSIEFPPGARGGAPFDVRKLDGPVIVQVGREPRPGETPGNAGLTEAEAHPDVCKHLEATDAEGTVRALERAGFLVDFTSLDGTGLEDGAVITAWSVDEREDPKHVDLEISSERKAEELGHGGGKMVGCGKGEVTAIR